MSWDQRNAPRFVDRPCLSQWSIFRCPSPCHRLHRAHKHTHSVAALGAHPCQGVVLREWREAQARL